MRYTLTAFQDTLVRKLEAKIALSAIAGTALLRVSGTNVI